MNHTARHALLALAFTGGLHTLASAAGALAPTGADPLPPTLVYQKCSWDHPGVNPFMGDVVAAVDRYRDIPPDVRAKLKERMARRDYDDLVVIKRDSIDGRANYEYGSTISDMHFGTHQLCRTVTRSSWSPEMEERGLVYCESGTCILIPTVCRNVSRITRADAAPPPPLAAMPPVDAPVADALPPLDWFGPTGAGVAPAGGVPVDAGDGFDWGGGAFIPFFAGGGGIGLGGGGGGGGGYFGGAPGSPPYCGGLSTAPVPEPQTWTLLAFGLAAIVFTTRKRRFDQEGR